jgi:hypothetical protein
MNMISVEVTLVTHTCAECGIVYAIAKNRDRILRENGETFFCPNGHAQVVCETIVQKLERDLARERAAHDQSKARIRQERERAEQIQRSERAIRGAKTRQENRISKGVCPCCRRHFTNIQRHMATKHPKFGNEQT